MTTVLYLYAIGIFLAGILNTIFGFSVYAKNRKNSSNKAYFLLALAFAVWCYSWFAMLLVSDNYTLALFFARLLNFGAVLIPVFFFQWIVSILGLEKENKVNIWVSYMLTILFAVLSWTKWYVSGVHAVFFFPYWPTAGFLYIFYLIFGYFTFPVYGIILLIKKFRTFDKTDKVKRNQLMYVLLGSLMGLGGGALNFLLMYGINPFGSFFEAGVFIVLIIFTPFAIPYAYATMKYHLMDIKIVLTEMTTGLISATLLIDFVFSIFTSAGLLVILFKFLVFAIFSGFGVMLIRSVLREIEQKEKIEKIEKELEKAYGAEKLANEELQNLDKSKNQFLMQVQHDLKRPLTAITWYADMLLSGSSGGLSEKSAEIIKRMQVVAQDKIKDVNNFLDIEQFKIGKAVVVLKPGVELMPIMDEIVNVLGPVAQAKGIYLKFEKPSKELIVNADREKLKAAIFNIVDNAVKYTPKGGAEVKIDNGNRLKITVSDTGIGIPQDKIKNIAEAQFERTVEAQKITTGSGVGLYLSGQIIKMHNGKVWAESLGDGKGSVFHIELPAATEREYAQEKAATPALKVVSTAGAADGLNTDGQTDKAKSEFVSLASHQMRTPLSAIKWYSEMLLDKKSGKLSPRQKKYLKEIYHGNERLIKLIDVLLTVSRLEAGKIKAVPVEIDAKKMLANIVDEQEFARKRKKHELVIELKDITPGVSPKIFGDAKLVKMALENIIINAVKYTPENGKVICSIEKKDKNILFEVTDTGIGIPEDQQKRVFEKLFRANNATSHDPDGNGLGLYVAKSAIESSGGKIWFESKIGEGTKFSVALPAV